MPADKRRKCLFKESCSQFVYNQTWEQGFLTGLSALVERNRKCRTGYKIIFEENNISLKLRDGSIIEESMISPNIVEPIRQQLRDFHNKVGKEYVSSPEISTD